MENMLTVYTHAVYNVQQHGVQLETCVSVGAHTRQVYS